MENALRAVAPGEQKLIALMSTNGDVMAASFNPLAFADFLRDRIQTLQMKIKLRERACRVAIVGDSFVGHESASRGGSFNRIALVSPLAALNFLARQPFAHSPTDVFMTGGGDLTAVLKYILTIIAEKYEVCFVQGCHNDFYNNRSIDDVIRNYQEVVARLLAAGIVPVIVIGPAPNSHPGMMNLKRKTCIYSTKRLIVGRWIIALGSKFPRGTGLR